jgi:hypothetical protein
MKARTIMMTKLCDYCKTPITYRKIEKLRAGEVHGHFHEICKKMIAEFKKAEKTEGK